MKIALFSFILAAITALPISLGVAQETAPLFKNQKKSATKWGEVNLGSFLSLKNWKDQSDERDLTPEWETIVRERNNREIVGRFFQCVGSCRVERGNSFFNPSFRTAIYEGDEVQTIGESYAWVFLFDGTMVRLSPESSINLNELNIGVKENFLNARINAGNILWLSRNEALFESNNIRETDVLFFPLSLYEAQATPDRIAYDENQLIELVDEKHTVENQYVVLNKLVEENNLLTKKKPTYAFIVMPNATLMGYNPSIEMVTLLSGKSYFKSRSQKTLGLKTEPEQNAIDHQVQIQLRGFENATLLPVEPDSWMMIDEKGRSVVAADEHTYWLAMGEFITKHIPSLMVARELLVKKYSEFAFRPKYDPKDLAKNDGYRLWGQLKTETTGAGKDDLELRLDFLKEYFRRVETTNLLVSSQFSERLKERGEALKSMEYGNFFFIKALKTYYSYEDYTDEKETGEVLNSTTKALWKRMHGIK